MLNDEQFAEATGLVVEDIAQLRIKIRTEPNVSLRGAQRRSNLTPPVAWQSQIASLRSQGSRTAHRLMLSSDDNHSGEVAVSCDNKTDPGLEALLDLNGEVFRKRP
ncbi:MAG: hypothetical protein XD36_3165 [Halomonas sp. 54_146]|nr:MAG: hypothetical protein XD36_3165 [Halomonas sp. 54_146]HAA44276.1 hypothetical protein [Halomonas sp.]